MPRQEKRGRQKRRTTRDQQPDRFGQPRGFRQIGRAPLLGKILANLAVFRRKTPNGLERGRRFLRHVMTHRPVVMKATGRCVPGRRWMLLSTPAAPRRAVVVEGMGEQTDQQIAGQHQHGRRLSPIDPHEHQPLSNQSLPTVDCQVKRQGCQSIDGALIKR